MYFSETAVIALPAPDVFTLMADNVESLVPHLPNIVSIRTDAAERKDQMVSITTRVWQALPGHLPRAFRPFLSAEMMRWTDHSVWDASDFSETWTVTNSGPATLYTCTGTNSFAPHPDAPETHTLLRFTGQLDLNAEQIKGVPAFVGRRLKPKVEAFIVGMITKNFSEVIEALKNMEAPRRVANL